MGVFFRCYLLGYTCISLVKVVNFSIFNSFQLWFVILT